MASFSDSCVMPSVVVLTRKAIRSLAYDLSAEFRAADTGGGPTSLVPEFWKHDPGRKSFQFEVIPRLIFGAKALDPSQPHPLNPPLRRRAICGRLAG